MMEFTGATYIISDLICGNGDVVVDPLLLLLLLFVVEGALLSRLL